MTFAEAKQALAARRPDGRDDTTPLIAEALQFERVDPELRAWLNRRVTFDLGVAAGLRAVAPPSGLREAILAGRGTGRGSRVVRSAWVWAIAACLAVMGVLIGSGLVNRGRPTVDDLVAMALHDVASPDHVPMAGVGEDSLAAVLARPGVRVGAGTTVDFARLAAEGCRRLKVGGREVFEVCFQRAGNGKIHMYIALEIDFIKNDYTRETKILESGGRALATWAEQGRRYVLVSDDGAAGIRNLL